MGRKERADWWSAGQARRQQTLGAATEMMLDLAGIQAGSRVLDVAAGTGDSALMAAARVGPKGHVLAADVSASMLNVAAEAARQAGLTNVETRVMGRGEPRTRPGLVRRGDMSDCSHAIPESGESADRNAPRRKARR